MPQEEMEALGPNVDLMNGSGMNGKARILRIIGVAVKRGRIGGPRRNVSKTSSGVVAEYDLQVFSGSEGGRSRIRTVGVPVKKTTKVVIVRPSSWDPRIRGTRRDGKRASVKAAETRGMRPRGSGRRTKSRIGMM